MHRLDSAKHLARRVQRLAPARRALALALMLCKVLEERPYFQRRYTSA